MGVGVRKEGFTVRNSLSRRGGYRGGCGAKEGEDLERRTPKRFHRLLLRCAGGCAWERTKVIDGSVGSDERILSSLCGSYDKEMDEAEETGQKRRREERDGTGKGCRVGRGLRYAGLICSLRTTTEGSNHQPPGACPIRTDHNTLVVLMDIERDVNDPEKPDRSEFLPHSSVRLHESCTNMAVVVAHIRG
jgi:hypothetical protein